MFLELSPCTLLPNHLCLTPAFCSPSLKVPAQHLLLILLLLFPLCCYDILSLSIPYVPWDSLALLIFCYIHPPRFRFSLHRNFWFLLILYFYQTPDLQIN